MLVVHLVLLILKINWGRDFTDKRSIADYQRQIEIYEKFYFDVLEDIDERRKNAFIEFCKLKDVKNVVIDEYSLNEYVKYVVENVGEGKKYSVRCEYCYYMRLKKVFEYAKENNFDVVSTTLTISPYQNHDLIKKVGKMLEEEYGIDFVYVDYRDHFREGQKMAREIGIYMQKYCGCVFSFDSGRWVY